MANETKYRSGQCGSNCHPIRYAVEPVTQGRWPRRTQVWGIRDRHLGVLLPRECRTPESADSWCGSLLRMEQLERQSKL